MLKWVNLGVIGFGGHRSGWPYVIDSLRPLFSDDGVLFDDFIDRTFLYGGDAAHEEPWVGVVHHSPSIVEWFPALGLDALPGLENWERSRRHLRLLICTTARQQAWFKETYPDLQTIAIRHPTGRPPYFWRPDRFFNQAKPKLLQVGWFNRNTYAIFQAECPNWLTKATLPWWREDAHQACIREYSNYEKYRRNWGTAEVLPRQDDDSYDKLLASSVVFVEFLNAEANNTVVECIARNTPICVNRLPGPEYYLGPDYPLFYDDFHDIKRLLTKERVLAAHHYLRTMDKRWIRGNVYRESVRAACLKYVPECRDTNVGLTEFEALI